MENLFLLLVVEVGKRGFLLDLQCVLCYITTNKTDLLNDQFNHIYISYTESE